jgi:hypothetical protein
LGDAGLAVFRAVERAAVFGLDLGLVMESSRFVRRHPPHHLSPAQANAWQGSPPKRALALQVTTATLRLSRKASQF